VSTDVVTSEPSFPLTSLADALDHTCAAVAGPEPARSWWLALHTALADPAALTVGQLEELPERVRSAIHTGCDDTIVEAWLESPEICDRVWTIGAHCAHDHDLVAHLVIAAANGTPAPVAEFLLRDLTRMSAIVGDTDRHDDVWGGHVAANARVDASMRLAARLGVTRETFRDMYDAHVGPRPELEVDAVCWEGIRLPAVSVWHVAATATAGDVVVIDAGSLYDRLVMRVTDHSRPHSLIGVELVSNLDCRLEQDGDRWTFTAAIECSEPIPALFSEADDLDDDWEFPGLT
jgi:hypothetical protein